MTDDQAAHLIRVLEDINDQLLENSRRVSDLLLHTQGNSVRIANLETLLASVERRTPKGRIR